MSTILLPVIYTSFIKGWFWIFNSFNFSFRNSRYIDFRNRDASTISPSSLLVLFTRQFLSFSCVFRYSIYSIINITIYNIIFPLFKSIKSFSFFPPYNTFLNLKISPYSLSDYAVNICSFLKKLQFWNEIFCLDNSNIYGKLHNFHAILYNFIISLSYYVFNLKWEFFWGSFLLL